MHRSPFGHGSRCPTGASSRHWDPCGKRTFEVPCRHQVVLEAVRHVLIDFAIGFGHIALGVLADGVDH